MKHTLVAAVAAVLSLSAVARPAAAAEPVADLKGWLAQPADKRPPIDGQPFATSPLSKADAEAAFKALWADHLAVARATRIQELKDDVIKLDGFTMKLKVAKFGNKPAGGWNLFISMHGGGGAPAAVNDQQWSNQVHLYDLTDSLCVAPRAPTDAWDMWHQKQIDPLFTRLIDDMIAVADVNPNRVYLVGYSAGGDGCYQLAPRMADHWAAAGMMAGHPGDASPLSLRDLPFTLHVGALDDAYHRNELVPDFDRKLNALQKADPKGYVHWAHVHAGLGHWMNREDAEAIPWMMKYTRDPRPDKVVWCQDDVTSTQFYWLSTPADQAKQGQIAAVTHDGQTFTVDRADGGLRTLTILMNDKLVDLDRPITIQMNGKTLYAGKPTRTMAEMYTTMAERGDPEMVFSATQTVTVGQ